MSLHLTKTKPTTNVHLRNPGTIHNPDVILMQSVNTTAGEYRTRPRIALGSANASATGNCITNYNSIFTALIKNRPPHQRDKRHFRNHGTIRHLAAILMQSAYMTAGEYRTRRGEPQIRPQNDTSAMQKKASHGRTFRASVLSKCVTTFNSGPFSYLIQIRPQSPQQRDKRYGRTYLRNPGTIHNPNVIPVQFVNVTAEIYATINITKGKNTL